MQLETFRDRASAQTAASPPDPTEELHARGAPPGGRPPSPFSLPPACTPLAPANGSPRPAPYRPDAYAAGDASHVAPNFPAPLTPTNGVPPSLDDDALYWRQQYERAIAARPASPLVLEPPQQQRAPMASAALAERAASPAPGVDANFLRCTLADGSRVVLPRALLAGRGAAMAAYFADAARAPHTGDGHQWAPCDRDGWLDVVAYLAHGRRTAHVTPLLVEAARLWQLDEMCQGNFFATTTSWQKDAKSCSWSFAAHHLDDAVSCGRTHYSPAPTTPEGFRLRLDESGFALERLTQAPAWSHDGPLDVVVEFAHTHGPKTRAMSIGGTLMPTAKAIRASWHQVCPELLHAATGAPQAPIRLTVTVQGSDLFRR